ncbi:glyoxalase [Ornithinimicrobium ciconiae]|uniref:Glyoxalase n=1 Tax=Ornithinimicrobium ciconiae TaxID=2594265 RepID=A0A516GD59_9MICO|nr:VOC family protein [Ornithinimicrobium ciconiae]QDO89290.1 glyoxalase [Ornithinimicrobium ciconiae]
MRLHHMQVSMPPGGEEQARAFYARALGMVEVEKPPELARRGGCWFRSYRGDQVTAEIHVSVEEPFVPARKAHPALELDSISELESLGQRVAAAGFDVSWDERHTFDGYERFHCRDGFGNRVEILTAAN